MSCDRPPRQRTPSRPTEWTVSVEIQDPLPVTVRELDAVERYFADIIAQAMMSSRQNTPKLVGVRDWSLSRKSREFRGATSIAAAGASKLCRSRRMKGRTP